MLGVFQRCTPRDRTTLRYRKMLLTNGLRLPSMKLSGIVSPSPASR
jgi:hypothetical protein